MSRKNFCAQKLLRDILIILIDTDTLSVNHSIHDNQPSIIFFNQLFLITLFHNDLLDF